MNPPATGQPLISLVDLTKHYPGVRAVDNASLDIDAGEVHGLVGENGAGKSTLIKILAGAVPMDSGKILVQAQPVTLRSVHDAGRLGLAFIHQELNLVPYFDAAENIFLGYAYPRTVWGGIRWQTLGNRAAAILAQLGAEVPVHVPVRHLSPGQQTLISIGRALAAAARLIVMDEPTASLTDQEIDHLFGVIRSLKGQGIAVLYVSHRLREIFTITDRVTVMRNGQVVTTQPTATLTEPGLVQLMTGRAPDAAYPPRPQNAGKPVLRVEGLTGDHVREIHFTLHAGEVIGVAGLIGAGRSSLLHMIFGAAPVRGGTLAVRAGNDLTPVEVHSPGHAFRLGMALAPEERRSQGLILSRPIYENTTLTFLRKFARHGWLIDRARELAVTGDLSRRLGLRSRSLRQPVGQLSGGNQQKVVFARCLAGQVRVLLLDEPTRGIDVGAKQEIYQLIRSLTAQGVAVLLVSSELSELLGLSDQVLVLREGQQMAMLDAATTDEETVLRYCYGVAESTAARV